MYIYVIYLYINMYIYMNTHAYDVRHLFGAAEEAD